MKAIVGLFVRNPVAANLLMVIILLGGVLTLNFSLTQEVFPEVNPGMINIDVIYPGAAPEEVEKGVIRILEERIQDIDGIDEISSVSSENRGSITVILENDVDVQETKDEINSRIDAVDNLPDEIEDPVVRQFSFRYQVLNVAIWGDTDELSLKRYGEQVREDIVQLPSVTLAQLVSTRPYEITVEVSESDLRRYGLTLQGVAAAIRGWSLNLPGGSVETRGGEILLRTEGQAYDQRDFEEIVLRAQADGTRLYLRDVATVTDGFAKSDQKNLFDGKPSVMVQVFRVGDQDALTLKKEVADYLKIASEEYPEGVEFTIWQDDTKILRSRLDTLIRNGIAGFTLVFILLALFLRFRLASWVALGIPISFLGTIWLMPSLGITINLISLFAFIVVLGIVVDDAIVVGENIYAHHHQAGKEGLQAAVDGVEEVTLPVVFAVLTSVAAFYPLMKIPGNMGEFMGVIPKIVILTLLFSLVECLLILPAHLSNLQRRSEKENWFQRKQRAFNRRLEQFIETTYRRQLELALEWRYLTLSIATFLLLFTLGLVAGGWVRFDFFPPVEADNVVADVTMPLGTSIKATEAALKHLDESATLLQKELEAEGHPVVSHRLTSLAEQPFRTRQSQSGGEVGTVYTGSHIGEVNLELVGSEERTISTSEVMERWRELTGPIAGTEDLSFTSNIFSAGRPIHIRLDADDLGSLENAAAWVRGELESIPGVRDISDSFRQGKREAEIELLPAAAAYGFDRATVARQIRQAFYGEEVQRIQRGRDDVKVMVRYPEAERRSLNSVEGMYLRTREGREVPFEVVARLKPSRGYASIQRINRRRTVEVTADIDRNVSTSTEANQRVEETILASLEAEFPQVSWTFGGEQVERQKTMGGLARGFLIALVVIFALMAIPFKSYLQPAIVLTAVPFGLVGAIWGHVMFGKSLTMLSFFGVVALTGVVVNDSLILVDFINRKYRGGLPLVEAVREAGIRRFRPIILTSLTTFVGLLPLILEKSVQAQFLIPMALSLAFGVLFATLVTLLLVPVTYLILEDLKRLVRRGGESEEKTY